MSDADPSRPFPGSPGEWLDDARLAAGFLSRVVPPLPGPAGARPLAGAARAFPLIGAALGLGAGAVYAGAAALGLAPALAAICAVVVLVLATGALHEDGLCDTADGFGGGADKDDKLAIMGDSRIGSYGVIAVSLSLVARIAALAVIADPALAVAALVATGAASRAALPAVMLAMAPARRGGLGAAAGRPGRRDVALGGALALIVALLALDAGPAVATLAFGALAALAVALLARRQIGGYTGDVLGAVQQISEVAMLFTIAANIAP